MCGGGWLPRVGELWIDGETWKAGHASSQPAHFQGPSSRGSSTALSPWSHFPLCPPSSSSDLKGDLHSQEEEKVLLVVAWGPVVSLGHLGSVSVHRFRSPWGPRARAMSPYPLSPWPLRPPCLVPSASLSQSHLRLHVQGMYMHASHLGPFPLCFFITRGPGGDVTWWVWPRDLKESPWPSQWCGIPLATPPFLFTGAEGLHPVRAHSHFRPPTLVTPASASGLPKPRSASVIHQKDSQNSEKCLCSQGCLLIAKTHQVKSTNSRGMGPSPGKQEIRSVSFVFPANCCACGKPQTLLLECGQAHITLPREAGEDLDRAQD